MVLYAVPAVGPGGGREPAKRSEAPGGRGPQASAGEAGAERRASGASVSVAIAKRSDVQGRGCALLDIRTLFRHRPGLNVQSDITRKCTTLWKSC